MRKTSLALSFALCIVASGCAPVQPWERGTLAKEHMSSEPYPLQRGMREHVYGGREAAAGGGASKGGGCGCY